jgi:glycosyltransferase involved in cell wall biosynthesis
VRIALVTREYPPETDWGGIGSFYAAFASALASQGHEIEVFSQGLATDRTEERDGILIHRIVPRKWLIGPRQGGDLGGMGVEHIGIFALSLAVAMTGRVALRHRVKPFDIVEGHEHLGINALLNVFGKSRFSSVSRYHTTYHSLVSRGLVDWPRSRLIYWLERMSIRSADARISASAYIERMTREDFPGVPPCDDIIPLLSDHLVHSDDLPFDRRDKLVIFVGRLVPGHKSPELAAKAFAELAEEFPDWRMEFAGADMPAKDGGTCWQACERILSPYPGRYQYHGSLGQSALMDLYRRARIIQIPSRFESFGLVALEAMASGVVPVVADGTALPEVVGDCGIVFRNGSSDDLRAKLRQIMADEASQITLSNAGQQRVLQDFSREHVLAKNTRFFEALAVACLQSRAPK